MLKMLFSHGLVLVSSVLCSARSVSGVVVQAREAQTSSFRYQFGSVAITAGGFITGFVAHPTTSDVLYVRTDIGSSYRWDARAEKWTALTDFISADDNNYFGTESFALDPTNDEMLYLAQGQYTSSNHSAFFVSKDRGNTFDIYPAPFPMGSNELGRNDGERLAVNPFNNKELFFGTRTQGLWKSANQAKTWTNVTNFPDIATEQRFGNSIGLVEVLFDPSQEGRVFVFANVPNGIHYSDDGGSTWLAVPGQPQNWDGVALNSSNAPYSTAPQPMRASLASDGTLYVTFADFPGPYAVQYGSFWKINTATWAWTDITPGKNNNTYPPPYTPQAFPPGGYCGLTIIPSDPNTVIVASMDRDPGPAIDSIYLSRDQGKTYKDISQLSTPNRTNVGGFWGHPMLEATLKNGTAIPWLDFDNAPRSGSFGAPDPIVGDAKFGWWMGALLLNPTNPDQFMYGTGATIWATDNISAIDSNSAPGWYVNVAGIEETANLALISPSKGVSLISGMGDIGGFTHTSIWEPQHTFEQPLTPNVDDLTYAGANQSVIARVGPNGVTYADGSCGNGAYSTDGGYSWAAFPTCAPGTGTDAYIGGRIAVDATGKTLLWTTAKGSAETLMGPYVSTDYGVSWTASTGLPAATLNIEADKAQANTFYAFVDSAFYISTDGGATFTKTTSNGIPANAPDARPVPNFRVAGELWLPLGSLGIWHSTDFGATFTRIGHPGTIAGDHFFSIGAPPPGKSNVTLYLWGTATKTGPTGLFRSDDSGVSWKRINDDQHQYGGPVRIQGDSQIYGRVYMGIFGRGIIYADIAGSSSGVIPGTYGI